MTHGIPPPGSRKEPRAKIDDSQEPTWNMVV